MEFYKDLPYQVNGKIVMIPRGCLEPHPDNPRKDLGDLTELRESIKANGIMQNLTVVPVNKDWTKFRILIGHRRFAASEGVIDTLPCAIAADIDQKEQVSIMLCENIQRSDLTYIEQAHGFQMMLDLGDEIKDISNKTGFSAQTIKHRLAIAELPEDLIKEVSENNNWQLTMNDFIELEKVEDLEERQQILEESCNSEDLFDSVAQYIREKNCDKNYEKLVELFNELGFKESTDRRIAWSGKYQQLVPGGLNLEGFGPDFKRIRELAKKTSEQVVYIRTYFTTVYIVVEIKNKPEKKEKTPEELEIERKKANMKKVEVMRAQLCDEYFSCIDRIDNKTLLKMKDSDQLDLIKNLFELIERCEDGIVKHFTYKNYIGKEKDLKDLTNIYQGFPIIKRLMFQVWNCLADPYRHKLTEWNYTANNESLNLHRDFIDNVLYHFGLRLEDELDDLLWGESELFEPDVPDEEDYEDEEEEEEVDE